MLEQGTRRFLFEKMSKALVGTDVIPVLSQMILDRVTADRADLCLDVKTPGFSYHSLFILNKRSRERDVRQHRLHLFIYFHLIFLEIKTYLTFTTPHLHYKYTVQYCTYPHTN